MAQNQQFRSTANIFLPLKVSITAFRGHSKNYREDRIDTK